MADTPLAGELKIVMACVKCKSVQIIDGETGCTITLIDGTQRRMTQGTLRLMVARCKWCEEEMA